ncbi:hypothetical protein OsI_38523 [Oryza sativa Indica Group]|uniref:F-box domain-containing protein n=1 Tax=Oryza sativa subsp. indica TaxID=39946 RepID=B8BM63_ORYSI|nr:hypothetical protein OsI_38523 [Oryza sativa Indica Group]
MEDLPDALIGEIVKRVSSTSDLSSLSLVSKRLYKIEAESRHTIHIGCSLRPATDAIVSLCSRFHNLLKVDINYSGWTQDHGNQLDNHGLRILSSYCLSLSDITLSFCSYIDDTGLGYLAFCRKLITLRLNSATKITSSGLLAVAVGCKNLSALHLIDCNKISGAFEWLNLLMFGPGWMKLQRFVFEFRNIYSIFEPKDPSYVANCQYRYDFSCENLKQLSLRRDCDRGRNTDSALSLGKCKSLEKLCLHFVLGLTDSDMITLAQNCSNLRSISLQLEPVFCEGPEEIGFTQEGLMMFFQSCPIRDLVLCGANIFDDEGMKALSSAQFLQTLELMDCVYITDAGMCLLADSPSLVNLTLRQSDGFSDVGVGEVVRARKLDSLIVEGCSRVSQKAVLGTAKSVRYERYYPGYGKLRRSSLSFGQD